MAHYLDKIEKLSLAAGFPSNTMEKVQISILEGEVEILNSMVQAKRKVIITLDEILERKRLELKAERDYEDRFPYEVREDINKFKQKNMILIQYLSTLDSEDFPLFKINQSLDKTQEEFYTECSTIMAKAKSVYDEFKKLQELQEKCDQLRLQTAN